MVLYKALLRGKRLPSEWGAECVCVCVFDAKYEDGTTGAMALDSGAGVNVWPQDWWNEAKMAPKAPGLKMMAANGAEIANLAQTVINFNAIQPADFAGQR